jgi:hypothetical protein
MYGGCNIVGSLSQANADAGQGFLRTWNWERKDRSAPEHSRRLATRLAASTPFSREFAELPEVPR